MSQLIIKDVRKSYGPVEVLKGVSIDIESGEFCVFVGPSGCGKSTLLRMIAGLETVTSGELRLEGRLINDVDPAKRGVAMVFQNYALYPHMTVAENMAFSLRLSRAPRAERDEKVRKAARILRLEPLLDRRPSQLSGGQKQRVAIGRAIVREPKVFLFDEPLSNLDAELRVQMRSELAELHHRLGITMIYVTHDQVEAMTLADKMVVMNGGVVQQQGRPLDLYDDPANTFVAGFVGTPRMNFLRGRVTRSSDAGLTLSGLGGTAGEVVVPSAKGLPVGTEVQVGIRPEHLHPNPPDSPTALPVRIGLVEELGSISVCHGRLPDSQPVTVQLNGRFQGSSELIHVAPELNRICLFDAEGGRVHV